MGHEFINDVLSPLSIFGGIALVIWASAKAKLEHRKLDIRQGQPAETRAPAANEDKVLTEMKAIGSRWSRCKARAINSTCRSTKP